MKGSKFLLSGLLVTSILLVAPSKASSMPPQLQNDIRHAFQTGDTRQSVQLGFMAGSILSYCLMAKEGMVVPGEGPVTIDDLNDISRMLLEKVRAELDDYLFPYQKVGLNMGINECNKTLGVQLDYR